MAIAPIPPGYASVTPYLVVSGAARAIDFYQRAFGAVEPFRLGSPDGTFGHVWSLGTHVEDVPPQEMDRRFQVLLAPAAGA